MERVYEEGSPEYGSAKPWADIKQYQRDRCMTLARFALEAAAPHMLAPVYEEGWLASRDFYLRLEGPVGGLDANPYRAAQ